MEPEDIVNASLAGLELGEVVCAPTVGEPSLLGAWEAAAIAVFAVHRDELAQRYLIRSE
jgi:hypothetical protein